MPRETYPNEHRVAITPQNVALLLKKGFARVLVERGAGSAAQLPDDAYLRAGATLVDAGEDVYAQSHVVLKVRGPLLDSSSTGGTGSTSSASTLRPGTTLISFLYPAQNPRLVQYLADSGVTAFAMDMIPRISRAQVFDALRSVECRGL